MLSRLVDLLPSSAPDKIRRAARLQNNSLMAKESLFHCPMGSFKLLLPDSMASSWISGLWRIGLRAVSNSFISLSNSFCQLLANFLVLILGLLFSIITSQWIESQLRQLFHSMRKSESQRQHLSSIELRL
ncbi:hypothetical protein Ciccas_006105, partial [Cichlidogyrus casuarinus]